MAAIKLRNLQKSYGDINAIGGIDLELQAGEVVVLTGPPGSGKSALLRLLCGLESPSGGDVLFDECRVNYDIPSQRRASLILPGAVLFPHLSVIDNLLVGLALSGEQLKQADRRAREIAELLQISDLLDCLPKQLTDERRLRVSIARELLRQPKVVLFDNPLSALSGESRAVMCRSISILQHEAVKATMVYATDNRAEAMALADKMCVLKRGRIEQFGSPSELYRAPKSIFVADFLSRPKINIFEDERARAQGCHALGVRPEDLVLSDSGGMWRGRVVRIESICSEKYLSIDIGLPEWVIVKQDQSNLYWVGDLVSLTPNRNNIIRFDSSGLSI